MPETEELEEMAGQARAVWSGAITFGLLSLPVDLFPASRSRALPLKLVDDEHRPLARRYFCPAHERFLTRDEIVRGYEIEKDRYVIVTDAELESIAPEKSRTIDLRTFVEAADIDPMYFKRSYFLTPGEGGGRAYRLLAETMERSGRVGLATFVMRDKEYLVALLSEEGILRAETLRFADELRRPEEVGLDLSGKAPAERVTAFRRSIAALESETLERADLEDAYSERLQALIDRKLERGVDVERAPEAEAEEVGEAEVIDLMEVLKRRLQPETAEPPSRRAEARARARQGPRRKSEALERLSKGELYERAKALGVPGRSKMDKDELIRALRS